MNIIFIRLFIRLTVIVTRYTRSIVCKSNLDSLLRSSTRVLVCARVKAIILSTLMQYKRNSQKLRDDQIVPLSNLPAASGYAKVRGARRTHYTEFYNTEI